MSSDLEEQLAWTLTRGAEEAPVPGYDPVGAVRGRQRRRRRRRAGVAAVCAIAVATVAVLTGVRVTVPQPEPGPEYVFSPDRIPDFTDLPSPEKVWPNAVHRLPAALPDGSRYTVVAVLGDGRYLVVRGTSNGEAAPSVFDTRAGTVTSLGTPAVNDGLTNAQVLMAREVNGRVVWFLEGIRKNRPVREGFREAWVAPLGGGAATRLAILPDGTSPRFSVAGDAIIWEQESRPRGGGVRRVVRSVSLHGGEPVDVPDSVGFVLAYVGPWITNQLGVGTPRNSGELRNVVTGQRLEWTANSRMQSPRCGPTWCTGRADVDRVALQSLDGSEPVELPWTGELSPLEGGRLAVGQLELPAATLHLVWDRTTGKAAGVEVPRPPDASPGYGWNMQLSDLAPEVLTVRSTDGELVVLDLGAIR